MIDRFGKPIPAATYGLPLDESGNFPPSLTSIRGEGGGGPNLGLNGLEGLGGEVVIVAWDSLDLGAWRAPLRWVAVLEPQACLHTYCGRHTRVSAYRS